MPAIFNRQHRNGLKWKVLVALLLVYIVWGTTYFALAIALETMPVMLMNALRFLLAGTVMLAVARWQGLPWPTAVQWRNAAVVGGCMVFLAMTLISFAQSMGIGSGLMATVVTTMPMWLALWSRWGGERVPLTSWIGLVLGAGGALLLALEGDFATSWLGALLAFGAPVCWSLGSYASRRLSLPAPAMASAAQWLAGGAMALVVALCFEPLSALGQVSARSWIASAYLLVCGTLLALNAYLWLLQNSSAALAGSYSFVNPAVALLIGVLLGGEVVTGWVYLALPLIGAALAFILYGQALQRWLAGRWSARLGSTEKIIP